MSIPKTQSITLDNHFWKNFANRHWEKKPLHLKNVNAELVKLNADDIFQMLLKYSDLCRKRKDPSGFKFYIHGYQAGPDDVLQILPIKSDKTLLGYHQRMEKEFEDYCLVCDELLNVSEKYHSLLTAFTGELYRHVGQPNRFTEIGLYLGNYRKTPFGVHTDRCGVFSFPVVGTKKFRLWSPAYGKKNPKLDRAQNYSPHKKASTLLKVECGDLSYWPSSAWHIAESTGDFSATWSLGVWVDKKHRDMISNSLQNMLADKLGKDGETSMTRFKSLHSPSGEVTQLPEAIEKSLRVLKNLSLDELTASFLQQWMGHVSLQGFKTIAPSELKITPRSKISLRHKESLVLWQQDRKSPRNMYFSFAGQTVMSPHNPSLLNLIKSLNSGAECQVADFTTSSSKKNQLEFLQQLAVLGAFK